MSVFEGSPIRHVSLQWVSDMSPIGQYYFLKPCLFVKAHGKLKRSSMQKVAASVSFLLPAAGGVGSKYSHFSLRYHFKAFTNMSYVTKTLFDFLAIIKDLLYFSSSEKKYYITFDQCLSQASRLQK